MDQTGVRQGFVYAKKSLIINVGRMKNTSNRLYELIFGHKNPEITKYMPSLEEIVTLLFLKSLTRFLYSSPQDVFSGFDKKSNFFP